jgi:hypothetical protein
LCGRWVAIVIPVGAGVAIGRGRVAAAVVICSIIVGIIRVPIAIGAVGVAPVVPVVV